MAILTALQIAAVAAGAGFSGNGLVNAVAVALAESGGNSTATYQDAPGSVDRGLWQVNSLYHPDVSDAQAFDPAQEASAVYHISNGGSDWSAWSTWQNGKAQAQLAAARTAVAQLGQPSQPQGQPGGASTAASAPAWLTPQRVAGGLAVTAALLWLLD